MSSPHFVRFSGCAVLRSAVVGAALTALVVGSAGVASADTGDSSAPSTITVDVVVGGVITLTGLSPSITLQGVPGQVVAESVGYTVQTNNTAGYLVTATAGAAALLPADTTANTDTIPVNSLVVGDPTGGGPLSTTPVAIHAQPGRSIAGGDQLSTDFSMNMPYVNQDTYSGTVTYLATAL